MQPNHNGLKNLKPGSIPLVGNSDQFLEKVMAYFRSCHSNGDEKEVMVRPYTMSGLALALNVNRSNLIMYERNEARPEFMKIMAYAKSRIEAFAEEQLYTNKNVSGISLSLKNNFGWRDQVNIAQERPVQEIRLVTEEMTEQESFQLYMDVINGTHAEQKLLEAED